MEIKCAYTELVDISTLVPFPRNPNQHSDAQIKLLAKIIKHQGWRSPIVVSKRSGFITKGHGRLASAKLNGWDKVPIDRQDYATEADEWADIIADNEIARLAEADQSLIRELALELPEGFDLDLLGIPDFEIAPVVEAQCDEDFVPEVLEPKVKPGELYILGNHRLLCGDSTNIQHVERLMGGEKADMVFTDPPYGINVTKGRLEGLGYKPVANDDSTEVAKEAFQVIATLEPAVTVYWGANYFTDFLPPSKAWIVWSKRTSIPAMSDAELAWTNFNCYVKEFEHQWDGPRKASEAGESRVHPTQKPVALAEWTFENYGNPKNVLDVFGGSGSTLIACEKTNRKCFMMELDPHYCSVILDRYAKFSGKDPIREDNIKWSEIKNGKA